MLITEYNFIRNQEIAFNRGREYAEEQIKLLRDALRPFAEAYDLLKRTSATTSFCTDPYLKNAYEVYKNTEDYK